MLIVEIVGVFSSGKSSLIREVSKNGNIISIHRILPVWFLLKHFEEGVIQNLIMEVYFLLRYNLRILRCLGIRIRLDSPDMSVKEKVNLLRSLLRKLGFVFTIEKTRQIFHDKILLVDEGFYQLIQNSITLSSNYQDFALLFELSYQPDLLIITEAADETIFTRSRSRNNLTQRYKVLSDENLYRVIRLSKNSFKDLKARYINEFGCAVRTIDQFEYSDLMTRGVLVFKNE